MPENSVGSYVTEKRVVQGDTVWVAIRARGAEWSWLTPAEAVALARHWLEAYGNGESEPAPDDEPALPEAAE